MSKWVTATKSIVADDGALFQVYPDYAPVGVDPATATNGQQMREPTSGQLVGLQVQTDGTNGGILELYDMSGTLFGINVSSTDVITNAQLVAALAAPGPKKARLIYSQNFIGSPTTYLAPMGPDFFLKGLVARVKGGPTPTGTYKLNLTVYGGYRITTKAG